MRLARHGAPILHPGPTNEGVELTAALASSARSLIGRQVSNGVAVRMAVLALLVRVTRFGSIADPPASFVLAGVRVVDPDRGPMPCATWRSLDGGSASAADAGGSVPRLTPRA